MIFRTTEELLRYSNAYRGVTIGITSGCFDLLHPLQVEYLNKCKRLCDVLVVLVDSDHFLNLNKNKYPLINENDRAFMVDNLKSVDITMVMNNLLDYETVLSDIECTANNVIQFKHSSTIYSTPVIQATNPSIKLITIPDVIRFQSTTEITNHLKQTS